MSRIVVLLVSCFVSTHGLADIQDYFDIQAKKEFSAQPGTTGANAFSAFEGIEDAQIPKWINIETRFFYVRDRNSDDTYAIGLKIEIPFGERASLTIFTHFENWSVSPETQEALGMENSDGSNLGDVNFSSKFLLFEETPDRPAISLKTTLKSPSGGDENRRNTDTVGFAITFLAAKNLVSHPDFLERVRWMVEVGFAAWDDGEFSQNDALKYGGAIQAWLNETLSVQLGAYGLHGWRNEGDRPLSGFIEIGQEISERSQLFLDIEKGFNEDANDFSISFGYRYSLGDSREASNSSLRYR